VLTLIDARSGEICRACQEVLDRHGLPAIATHTGSLWQILFTPRPPVRHADVMASDTAAAKALDTECIRAGLYVLPGVRRFFSAVHPDEDVERTVEALDAACRALAAR